MMINLSCVLRGALLTCFQFVLVVRQDAIIFYQVNGCLAIMLDSLGNHWRHGDNQAQFQ